MDLSALEDFHRVAGSGSLGQASRKYGRPKATLSRRIRRLEESLGVRLVERGRHALRLTTEGRLLYERTRGLLRDIEDIGHDVAAGVSVPRGVLKVSAPALFSDVFGGRLAAQFAARHADVRLQWHASDRPIDLAEEGFDAVIRVNPDPASELVGRCFAHDAMLMVAPPALALAPAGTEQEPARLPAVGMTGFTDSQPWEIRSQEGLQRVIPDYRLVLSSLLMVRAAAVRSGAGAALLPRSLVHQDIASGRLVNWGVYPGRTVDLWVLHSSRRLVSPKVSAFVSFLVESFPDQQL